MKKTMWALVWVLGLSGCADSNEVSQRSPALTNLGEVSCSTDQDSYQDPEYLDSITGTDAASIIEVSPDISQDDSSTHPWINPDPVGCDKPVRFVAVGNSGGGSDPAWELAIAIREKCKKSGCDFILLVGNTILPAGPLNQFDNQWFHQYEHPYGEIGLPVHAVLGSGDYGVDAGSLSQFKKTAAIYETYSKGSMQFHFAAPAYRFTEKYVAFAGIDTRMMMTGELGEQMVILEPYLSQKHKLPWHIAFGFDTVVPVTQFPGTAAGNNLEEGYKIFACNGDSDVLIVGYNPWRAWHLEHPACPKAEVISVGSGTFVNATYLPADPTDTSLLFREDTTPGFLWAEVTCDTFHGEFVDLNGVVSYSRNIKKTKP